MNLPGPSGRQPGNGDDNNLNTLGSGQVTVLGYSMPENVFAAACYLPLFPANVIPCVLALVNAETQNPAFIRFNAVQSLMLNGVFAVVCTIINMVMGVLGFIPVLGGLINVGLGLVLILLSIGYVLASLKVAVETFRGQRFELPFIAPYAEQYSKK